MKVLEFLMLYILSCLIYNVSGKEGRERWGKRQELNGSAW